MGVEVRALVCRGGDSVLRVYLPMDIRRKPTVFDTYRRTSVEKGYAVHPQREFNQHARQPTVRSTHNKLKNRHQGLIRAMTTLTVP
jgi:hypothetical protein